MAQARGGALVATVATFGAISRYPGGTSIDHATVGYDFSQNFLSDLGMSVAFNNERNFLGAALFVFALLLLVVSLGSCLMEVVRILTAIPGSRLLARVVSIVGPLACLAFVGVAMTPENAVMEVHITLTVWAWRIVTGVIVLLWAASVRGKVFPPRMVATFAVVAAMTVAYVFLLAWGPTTARLPGREVQVIAQKSIAVVVVTFLIYLSIEKERLGWTPAGSAVTRR